MADGNRMSRREWFRLRPRHTDQDAAVSRNTANNDSTAMGEAPDVLQTVAHPVNHDGMDLSELPPMREALLTKEQVRQLFSDIESLASDILLMQRSASSQQASVSRATTAEQLRTAQESLLSGNVPRVQIRYLWQETNWIDTLEAREQDVRLVRIAHKQAASARNC